MTIRCWSHQLSDTICICNALPVRLIFLIRADITIWSATAVSVEAVAMTCLHPLRRSTSMMKDANSSALLEDEFEVYFECFLLSVVPFSRLQCPRYCLISFPTQVFTSFFPTGHALMIDIAFKRHHRSDLMQSSAHSIQSMCTR
jgi:hypothetical protein